MEYRRLSVIAGVDHAARTWSLCQLGFCWLDVANHRIRRHPDDDLNQAKVVYTGTSAELKTGFAGYVIFEIQC